LAIFFIVIVNVDHTDFVTYV